MPQPRKSLEENFRRKVIANCHALRLPVVDTFAELYRTASAKLGRHLCLQSASEYELDALNKISDRYFKRLRETG